MSWARRWTRQISLAALGLAGATGVAGWAGWRALTLEPLTSAASAPMPQELPSPRPRPATPANLLRLAVSANPFRMEREPAPVAFRMPGDEAPAADQVPTAQILLLGTAVLPDGRSFAMCRYGDEQPRVVRVGERVGGYTLRSVAQGRAVFQTAEGSTLEVRVPKAGS